MTWWDERLCGFDLETTSAEPEEARIVQASLVLVGGGEETETLSLVVDPGVEVPEEAAAIHGYTTERVRAEGMPTGEALDELFLILGTVAQETPLVVFNARYDLTVLDRESRRQGGMSLADLITYVIDPLVIDKHLHRYRKGSRTLEAQAKHYGALLDRDAGHDAANDALTAARVAWCIGKKGRVIRRALDASERAQKAALTRKWNRVKGNLAALHQAQEEWAAEQAASLQEYFRKQEGREDEYVDPEWPVIPYRSPT